MPASATCEVWVDGQQVACQRGDLFAGEPTVLDDLTIEWGRRTLWEQPDAGTIAFRIRDQRTAPQPLDQIVHAGAKIDVWAAAPNPNPSPVTYMDQDFSTWFTDRSWRLQTFASFPIRTNRATDPSCTTTTGKTANGSAVLAAVNTWAQFGTTSISVTPAAGNNASGVHPQGVTGLTVFEVGKTYTVSCYVRLTAAQTGTLNANARRILIFGGAGGIVVASSAQAPNAAGVTRLSVTFTVDPTWTACFIRIMNGSPTVGDVLWYDGLLITEGATLGTYFDGTTTKQGYTYTWSGTANASSSTERYAATWPDAEPIAYEASSAPVGQGTRSAVLYNGGTRAAFEFNPEDWDLSWPRDPGRPMYPGETWTWSIMTRVPAASFVRLSFFARVSSNPDVFPVGALPINGGGTELTINGTGAWITTTGTVINNLTVPIWPTFYIYTPPESMDAIALMPGVDSLILTAPALAERRVLVWSGRVTDVEVEPSVRSAIQLSVTGAGAAIEVENVSVGEEPWPDELVRLRLRRIADAIPYPLDQQFTLAIDELIGIVPGVGSVRGRDVDKQPALDLIRDYSDDALGVAWPINHPAERNHIWIEALGARTGIWAGPSTEVSACDLSKSSFRVGQSTGQVITVVDVRWLPLVEGTNDTATVIDEAAAAVYGMVRLAIDTELTTEIAALQLAAAALDWARASTWSVSGLSFDSKHASGADAQELLIMLLNSATRPGMRLTITDLPEWVPVETSVGFVEGGSIAYRNGRWQFELNLSAGDPGGGS